MSWLLLAKNLKENSSLPAKQVVPRTVSAKSFCKALLHGFSVSGYAAVKF